MKLFLEHKPSELSDIYLLDEHRTHHAMESTPSLRQGHALEFIAARHDAVVAEMIKRGRMKRSGHFKEDTKGVGGNRLRYSMHFSPIHMTPFEVRDA